jgi:hypothetical protein
MIYLAPEVRSGLGEDTFWTWFEREIPSSFEAERAGPDDWLLQYATLGPRPGARTVALLWELYAEMDRAGVGTETAKIGRMRECFEHSHYRVVSSPSMRSFYPDATLLPIGVDTDLFAPRPVAHEGRVGFWCGTDHPMKGMDRLHAYRAAHPEIRWNIVEKSAAMPQTKLAELMNASDFILLTGRLRPYFMVEWEAMACDLPVVDISGVDRDFIPSAHPREDVMRFGWSRHDAKKKWKEYLGA